MHHALERIQARRDGRYNEVCGCKTTTPQVVLAEKTDISRRVLEAAGEVPPVPIEQAIEEAHAEETKPGAPASAADVIEKIQAAKKRGVDPMPIVASFLGEVKVDRVSNLSDEQRGVLVGRLS